MYAWLYWIYYICVLRCLALLVDLMSMLMFCWESPWIIIWAKTRGCIRVYIMIQLWKLIRGRRKCPAVDNKISVILSIFVLFIFGRILKLRQSFLVDISMLQNMEHISTLCSLKITSHAKMSHRVSNTSYGTQFKSNR